MRISTTVFTFKTGNEQGINQQTGMCAFRIEFFDWQTKRGNSQFRSSHRALILCVWFTWIESKPYWHCDRWSLQSRTLWRDRWKEADRVHREKDTRDRKVGKLALYWMSGGKEKETWIRCEKRLPNDRLSRLQDVNWWRESGIKEKRRGNGHKKEMNESFNDSMNEWMILLQYNSNKDIIPQICKEICFDATLLALWAKHSCFTKLFRSYTKNHCK